MKCKNCGQEIPDIPKTIKIPELKIEIETDVHNKNECLKDIKIPKGWRLLTVQEVIYLANSKYAKKLKMFSGKDDFFFAQPFEVNKKKGYVARFGAGSVRAFLYCYGLPRGSYSELGVRFCRSLKRR